MVFKQVKNVTQLCYVQMIVVVVASQSARPMQLNILTAQLPGWIHKWNDIEINFWVNPMKMAFIKINISLFVLLLRFLLHNLNIYCISMIFELQTFDTFADFEKKVWFQHAWNEAKVNATAKREKNNLLMQVKLLD